MNKTDNNKPFNLCDEQSIFDAAELVNLAANRIAEQFDAELPEPVESDESYALAENALDRLRIAMQKGTASTAEAAAKVRATASDAWKPQATAAAQPTAPNYTELARKAKGSL